MRTALDRNMSMIHDDILRHASLVNLGIERAMQAFRVFDVHLARQVVRDDDTLDSLQTKVQKMITTTIALHQPTARDLRTLMADMLIINELERMGDYAESIAKTVIRHEENPSEDIPPLLFEMAAKSRNMLQKAMDAFLDGSSDLARSTAQLDHELDSMYRQTFNMLVARMSQGDLPIEQGTYMLWTAHNLERIGDRITDICERIVYINTGDMYDLND
ncbi:MAG: phosphate signaling complex protein PhoU [Chloroflexi bacterium]|nr:phosphate signaling complex protein PhoU [Chloroflexota bacterium]